MISSFDSPIYVSRPLIPCREELFANISKVLDSKWLTNMGAQHNELEKKLSKVLKSPNISLFNNGAIALLVALKALDMPAGSEIITTPFTFAATPHAISWNGFTPVFCDIKEDIYAINENNIESLITSRTKAILAVHVYGYPCNVNEIEKIAKKYNIYVIYDAAHAFGAEINNRGIGNFGDISMFSFHATKLFNSVEGGCLTYNNDKLKEKIHLLRNFGIKNEEEVTDIGINGKMNEIQACIGLLNLDTFRDEQQKRADILSVYKSELLNIGGIEIANMPENVTSSYQYFVIKIKADKFGKTRDQVYEELKKYNVFARKYFYPLCSDFKCYRHLPSTSVQNLPIANKIKMEVLALPFFSELGIDGAKKICSILQGISLKR